MEVLTEFDCFINAFLAMEKTHTKEELFVPHSDKAVATAKEMKEMMDKSMQTIEKNSGMRLLDGGGAEVTEEERPRLFVMAGSGTGVMQVIKENELKMWENGEHKLVVCGCHTQAQWLSVRCLWTTSEQFLSCSIRGFFCVEIIHK